jgi:hypothetical protein
MQARHGESELADPINLRQARKAKARQEAQDAAAQARLRFGQSKSQKTRQKTLQTQAQSLLNAHKREPKP